MMSHWWAGSPVDLGGVEYLLFHLTYPHQPHSRGSKGGGHGGRPRDKNRWREENPSDYNATHNHCGGVQQAYHCALSPLSLQLLLLGPES